jgi:hypothetical protein
MVLDQSSGYCFVLDQYAFTVLDNATLTAIEISADMELSKIIAI